MRQTAPQHLSYATLFDPAVARAAVERAAQWDLPRHVCRPLDHYVGARVSADVAAYDATVELAPVLEEEMCDEPSSADRGEIGAIEENSDYDKSDDL